LPVSPTERAFSQRVIEALVEAITGGSAAQSGQPVGIYRSAGKLEQFFGNVDIPFSVGSGSRVPAVRDALNRVNSAPGGREKISEILEAVSDPEYYPDSVTADRVATHLNGRLQRQGVQLQRQRGRYRLVSIATNAPVTDALVKMSEFLDFDAVTRHFERALRQADADPEDAVTAACGVLESVCKSLLDEMGVPHPTKQDVGGLVRAVQTQLDLSPGRPDLNPDVRQILSGLTTVTGGVGALRTHGGDAHGQGKGVAAVTPALARLAIHAASTAALFFIETWRA
jgi:Abortive infection C-terminus